PSLEAIVDGVIDEIAAAQGPDGYLNTYFMFERAKDRWTNLQDMHELYCSGHLMQAAVAHHRATGKTSLLDVATRLADHICTVFGSAGRPGTPGHEEVEMALVELYRTTGERRYLDQAIRFIDLRGSKPPLIGGSEYHQDHAPLREQREIVGHAVRAVYLNCGAADVVSESGDKALLEALGKLWINMTQRRMYITGGLGARYEGEAFGRDYELPNDRAYAETCAAIGSIMWCWRMLALDGEGRYADLMETTLYNGMLAGLSLDGKSYFYQNPLADNGHHRREGWFGCACCPPNVARMLASLPGYFYSVSEGAAWVHLYAAGQADLDIPEGGALRIEQHADYPWSGDIDIEILAAPDVAISICLRIPGWCKDQSLKINGAAINELQVRSGYIHVKREWKAGDHITLQLEMPVELMESHPALSNNRGQVALCRGPLVYCLEGVDHPGKDLSEVRLLPSSAMSVETSGIGDHEIVALLTEGVLVSPQGWGNSLYRAAEGRVDAGDHEVPLDEEESTGSRPVNLRAIPYYAWANREAGMMRVWLPLANGTSPAEFYTHDRRGDVPERNRS
ncbi:MAG: glycoside hydrolase family 127 protein, partial [Armatimonadota bacterium]|nr:glycoside hydrolase family 127 protein [Armatimonadota bacterium]